MTAPAVGVLEPLASATLRRRLPHLAAALDAETMAGHLQRALLDGTGLDVEACARPRAELDGDVCSLQYPLRVRTPGGGRRELLVLGTMLPAPGAAAAHEREVLVPVAAGWAPELPAPRATATLAALDMAVSVFPVSGALPALVAATDPGRIAAMLGSPVAGVELVRLRRSGGAVLLYRLAGGGGVFGKAGYAASTELVGAVLEALPIGGHAGVAHPRVLGRSAELDLTLISRVPGRRPDLRVAAERGAAVLAAARVAAALHTSGIAAGPAHTLEDELARAALAVAAITPDAPETAAWLDGALQRARAAAGHRPEPAALAHGDLTPSQLLLDGTAVGVIDFDGVCQAEPAFDLGRFLAYLWAGLARVG
ncbi:MAG TPA: phosphotransferase, partial [Candidatus Dormibacteraeota bacterium]|nr:phosphotransferase [Candidatus Dormibacteraeota bacterium]